VALSRRRRDLLSEKFIRDLHKRMLGTYGAGRQVRTSQRNIGMDYWLIPVELRQLLDDGKAWIEFGTYPADEIAVRLHHRLVLIHPFPNGNGRHARLVADLLVMQLGRERFSWDERVCGIPAPHGRATSKRCAPPTITISLDC